MTRKGWFLLTRGVTGKLSPLFHWLDVAAGTTACGQTMPQVYGRFTSNDSYRVRLKQRCPACVEAREPEEKSRYRRDSEGHRHKVVTHEGFEGFVVRWTDACTGCFEYVEGYAPMGSVWDPKSKCYVGGGCHECGYTGKTRREEWIPFDMVAYERHANKQWYEEQERRHQARAEGLTVMP